MVFFFHIRNAAKIVRFHALRFFLSRHAHYRSDHLPQYMQIWVSSVNETPTFHANDSKLSKTRSKSIELDLRYILNINNIDFRPLNISVALDLKI